MALQPRSAVTGWGRGFETEPWLLLVFMGFGFAAGLRVLLRVSKRREASSDPEPGDPER